MTLRRLLCVNLALGLLACGGGGSDKGDSGTTNSTTSDGSGSGSGGADSDATSTGGTSSGATSGGAGGTGGVGVGGTAATNTGLCQAPEGPSPSSFESREEIYAAQTQSGPCCLGIRDDALVFYEGMDLLALPPDGGTTELIHSFDSTPGSYSMNDTHLFYIRDGSLYRVARGEADETAEVIAEGFEDFYDGIRGLTETHLYYFDQSEATLNQLPLDGSADAVEVATGVRGGLFQQHEGYFYYYRAGDFDDSLVRMPVDGGSEEVLFELTNPGGIELDGDVVYVGNGDGIYRAPIDGSAEPELVMLPPIGFPLFGDVRGVSIYDGLIYWVSNNPSVGWLDPETGECDSIVEFGVFDEDGFAAWGNVYYRTAYGIYKITP